MEFNLGVMLATVVNFLILFFGLKYFFFEKVKLIVEARENEISQKLDSADEELEKARDFEAKKNNESPIILQGTYPISWQTYSVLDDTKTGIFKILINEVR